MRALGSITSGRSVFRLESSGGTILGTATPVDRRGYFLTAAHCLSAPGNQVMLALQRERKTVEVVKQWRDEGRDLALLHSRVTLEKQHVFEQRGTKLRDGERVTIAGIVKYGRDSRIGLWQGSVDMKGSEDTILHIYTNPRKKLPNVQRGASGGPAVDRHGLLVGILLAVLAKRMPIGELLDAKRQRKLQRHLSKAYARVMLKTKFICKRCEVSPVLPPIFGELRTAIAEHIRELDWRRAEEIRASTR